MNKTTRWGWPLLILLVAACTNPLFTTLLGIEEGGTDNTQSGGLISLKADVGEGAFTQADFSISQPGGSQTVTMAGSGYTKPRWFVDGRLKEISFTIDNQEGGT